MRHKGRGSPKHTRRSTIVVLDDSEDCLEIYKHDILSQGIQSTEFAYFSTDQEAAEFVRSNRTDILGYIQDMNRPAIAGGLLNSTQGIRFFNETIDVFTPWAKCVISSATLQIRTISELLRIGGDRLRFVEKSFVDSEGERSLRSSLRWLLDPADVKEPIDTAVSNRIAVTQFAPAWGGLCKYLLAHEDFLHRMPSSDFELLAGEIFHSYGWEVDFTSRTRDGGYDVIAVRKSMPTPIRILVEAKRYAPWNPIGVDIIRSLYGVKQARTASQLVLVTSSFVTLDAKQEFSRVVPWELDFFERDQILDWCRQQTNVKLEGTFHGRSPRLHR